MRYWTLLLLLGLWACENETEEYTIDWGRDYYPINVGDELVYEYDSIIFNRQLSTIDTTSGQLKEVIAERLDDVGGRMNYRIDRYIRKNPQDPWNKVRVWRLEVESNKLIRTEENIPFTRLIFPTDEGLEWDGNEGFDSNRDIKVGGENLQVYFNWNYEIASKGTTAVINGKSYDDALVVSEVDNESIGRRYSQATYVRGIGLAQREMMVLDCTNCNENLPWPERGDKGFIYSQRLLSQ